MSEQCEERRFIERYFEGRRGRFLELGAGDGLHDSLTVGLVDAGWSGVQVEPDIEAFRCLRERREENNNIVLVNAAVGPSTGLRQFWAEFPEDAQGQLPECCRQEGTIDDVHRVGAISRGHRYRRPYYINVVSTGALLQTFGIVWDLVVIDAEGVSLAITQQMPLAVMQRTELICVEYDGGPRAVIAELAPWYNTQVIGYNVLGVRR